MITKSFTKIKHTAKLRRDIVAAMQNDALRLTHFDCLSQWCDQYKYEVPQAELAWTKTTSDLWVTWSDEQFEANATADERAEVSEIWEQWEDLEDAHGSKALALQAREAEIMARFAPEPLSEIRCWLPAHSCHFFGEWHLALAQKLFPETTFDLITNEEHTFVASKDGLVFDLLIEDIDPEMHFIDGDQQSEMAV
jgi:hypothetical protein